MSDSESYNGAGKLQIIALQKGETLDALIPRMLTEHKTVFKAALALGVYPAAIYNWLKKNPAVAKKFNYKVTQPKSTPNQSKNEDKPDNA